MRSFLKVREHLSSLTPFYVLPAPDLPYAIPKPFLTPSPWAHSSRQPQASAGTFWSALLPICPHSSLPSPSSPLTQSCSLSLQHVSVTFRRAFKMLTRRYQLQFLSRNFFPGNFQLSLIYKVVDRTLKSVHRFISIGSH